MTVTFVNLFTVPEGLDDTFLNAWSTVNEFMRGRPGYLGHTLHRSYPAPPTPYNYVNVATWLSRDLWAAAHNDEFRALLADPVWRECTSQPGLYDAFHHGGDASPRTQGRTSVTLRIEHDITDFDTWKAAFARFADARRSAGVRAERISQPAGSPHRISIDLDFDDGLSAERFEAFLRTQVWSSSTSAPALAGAAVTTILNSTH